MTEEEMMARIAELEKQNQDLANKNETLETNQKNQNSYITKLEQQAKRPEQQVTMPSSLSDKNLVSYLQKNMRRDTIDEAMEMIKKNVKPEVVECLKPELMTLLDKRMTIDNTRTSFVIDAFNLTYGEAMSNPEHPIHKLGQAQVENKPAAPPVNTVAANTTAQQKTVANVSDQLRAYMGAPVMTPSDTNAVQSPPVNNPHPISNTKDAMRSFKERLQNTGANRFS